MILSVFHKESIANVRNVLIRSAFMKNFIVRSIIFLKNFWLLRQWLFLGKNGMLNGTNKRSGGGGAVCPSE